MTDVERQMKAIIADSAALIERATADLALSEEPAGFITALDEGADDD